MRSRDRHIHIAISIFLVLQALSCAISDRSISVPEIAISPQAPLATITTWRIVGPFKLPPEEQVYTLGNEDHALSRDYLATIGGSETPFKIGAPTTDIKVDFDRDSVIVASGPIPSTEDYDFLNQVISFPVPQIASHAIFSAKSYHFKMMYAISNVIAAADMDADLIVSANSPVKVWLNDSMVACPPGSSVGNAQQIQNLLKIHLRKGSNYLVAKMYCFPFLNEFAVRIGSRGQALAFVKEKGGFRDLLEHIVVESGTPLHLTRNLLYFARSRNEQFPYRILSADNAIVTKSHFISSEKLEVGTQGLEEGLHTLFVDVQGVQYSQMFYIGSPERIYPSYKQRCESHGVKNGAEFGPCLSLAGLQEIHKDVESKGFRQDWQKKAIVYSSMIENGFHRNRHGFRMHAYRSPIDGQYQYFLFYMPMAVTGTGPVPVVVEVPHNAYGNVVAQDPEALRTDESLQDPYYKLKTQCLVSRDANYLLRLTLFCDEYGFACLFPYARFRQFEYPLAVADMLQVLQEAAKIYRIDRDRIYLRGFCRGGGNAIKIAEHYPDLFAGISSINLSVNPEPFSAVNGRWDAVNDIRNMVENLSHIPLQLIHGKHFPHSPVLQSKEFNSLSKHHKNAVRFEILEGDTQWDFRDEYRISFDFFKGKKRVAHPWQATYVTGHPQYNSAYWVRIKSLIEPVSLGRVQAQLDASGKIKITTKNVREMEIIPDRLPGTGSPAAVLNIDLNGRNTECRQDKQRICALQAVPEDSGKPSFIEARIGPIAYAFSEPFIIVQGTAGGKLSEYSSKRSVDEIEKSWKNIQMTALRRKMDYEITTDDLQRMNVILVGQIKTNPVFEKLLAALPLSIHAISISVGDYKYLGNYAVVVAAFSNPMNSQRSVVVVNSNRSAFVLPEPDLARYGADVVIWKMDPGGKPMIAGQWIWDASGTHLSAAPESTQKKELLKELAKE